ncbi:8538_t:CDS:2 [Ambispora leptoticha]|uniref:8538_t:CDS:1 n=1 Tax=Ambispora leptoticha TaxID=144679 RepID=A0A9N8ZWM9_9GLOM|nr:8538_t:CDS:2 [Ambispora leptoticha]
MNKTNINSYLSTHVAPIQQPNSPPQSPYISDMNGNGKISRGYDAKSPPKKEMYQYIAPWPVYGLDWSKRPQEKAFRLALGSFIEECDNKLQIITLAELAYDDPYQRPPNVDFVKIAEIDHQYPITKVLWEPYKGGSSNPDLLATAGDHLRLWEITDDVLPTNNSIGANNNNGFRHQRLIQRHLLANPKADFSAPLTSFDWNEVDPTLAVTSSIDTTCTVWNVETTQAKTQLIAHDKEVYDVAFASGTVDVFASVGADGSVRMFDLRSLEHSTIIYETNTSPVNSTHMTPPQPSPLLRLCFNKIDHNYLATFHMDSTDVQILDVRVPCVPVAELRGHSATVNCVNWAPHQSGYLCSGGDDSQVLVWDLHNMSSNTSGGNKYQQDPFLAYKADSEISQLSWSSACTDFVAIGFGSTVQALRV